MANKENMTLRIEPDLKAQAAALFKSLGMDLSTATGIFYRQALRTRACPLKCAWTSPTRPPTLPWRRQKRARTSTAPLTACPP